MIAVGIDPSTTCTGFVMLDARTKGVLTAQAYRPPAEGTYRRAQLTAEFLDRKLDGMPKASVKVVIEDYALASAKLKMLAEFGGIVRNAVLRLGFPMYAVAPQSLKKFVGPGAKEKEQVMARTKELFGFEHSSHDVVDAYVLARIGAEMMAESPSTDEFYLTKAMKEVIKLTSKKEISSW